MQNSFSQHYWFKINKFIQMISQQRWGLHNDKDYVLYYINNFMGWNIIYITTDSIKPAKTIIRVSDSTVKEYWPVHVHILH